MHIILDSNGTQEIKKEKKTNICLDKIRKQMKRMSFKIGNSKGRTNNSNKITGKKTGKLKTKCKSKSKI